MPAQEEKRNYAIERVTDFSSPLCARCLLILEQSISANIRLPRARLMGLLNTGSYRLYALRLANEAAGMALLYFSAGLPFVLLDYVAIDPDRRNQGLGSAFLRALADLIRQESPSANWLILEIDDDREGPEEERAHSRRRMEFYGRLGAQLLANVPYRFPSAQENSVPMRLMVYRLRPGAALSVEDVGAAIEDTFLHVHGRTGDDELLTWIRRHKPSFLELK